MGGRGRVIGPPLVNRGWARGAGGRWRWARGRGRRGRAFRISDGDSNCGVACVSTAIAARPRGSDKSLRIAIGTLPGIAPTGKSYLNSPPVPRRGHIALVGSPGVRPCLGESAVGAVAPVCHISRVGPIRNLLSPLEGR